MPERLKGSLCKSDNITAGSNPVSNSKQIYGIKDITFDFDSNNLGSIPSGSTIKAIALSEQKRVNSKKNNILLYLNWLKNYADTVGYGCSNQPSSTKPFTFG